MADTTPFLTSDIKEKYPYAFRRKSRWELLRMCAGVTGIDFCYAASAAFVSPMMLKLHIPVSYMTWVWVMPPVLGMVFNPLLGSLSDRCRSPLGRRRPLILSMTVVVLVGLLLLGYGYNLGQLMGDNCDPFTSQNQCIMNTTSNSNQTLDGLCERVECNSTQHREMSGKHRPTLENTNLKTLNWTRLRERNTSNYSECEPPLSKMCPVVIILTIIGILFVDFGCDGTQSPFRTYVIDLCTAEDQVKGLSMFTVIAGIGGCAGYVIGGIDWEYLVGSGTFLTQIHVIYGVALLMHLVCVVLAVTSFREIPLAELEADKSHELASDDLTEYENLLEDSKRDKKFSDYFRSIFCLPRCILLVCATNFCMWMAESAFILYFTDFVGQAVYHGSPTAPEGTESSRLYNEGVRLGSLAMAMVSVVTSVYSLLIERMVKRFGLRTVYIVGPAISMVSAAIMALVRNTTTVLLMAPLGGFCYATVFTVPYIAVNQYHEHGMFKDGEQIRGIGTDVALVTSMLQVAQIFVCLFMGALIQATGSTATVMVTVGVTLLMGIVLSTQIPLVENEEDEMQKLALQELHLESNLAQKIQSVSLLAQGAL